MTQESSLSSSGRTFFGTPVFPPPVGGKTGKGRGRGNVRRHRHARSGFADFSILAKITSMDIRELQQFIRKRYFATDSARGAPATFLWFAEEVGELAHAIGKHQRGD